MNGHPVLGTRTVCDKYLLFETTKVAYDLTVIPVVAVQLVGAGEPPGAVGPRADVGLVANVRAEVRAQVRRLLVLGTDSTEKMWLKFWLEVLL